MMGADEAMWEFFIVEGDKGSGDGNGDGKSVVRYIGEVDLEEVEGSVVYELWQQLGMEEEQVCEVSYTLSLEEDMTCAECLLAWDMVLGDAEVEGEGCDELSGLEGTTLSFGHVEPDQLYVDKNGEWFASSGESAVDGAMWRFEGELAQ